MNATDYGVACCLLHHGFSLGLLFNAEDGGDMLFRNFGRFSTGYTALRPTRQNSSYTLCTYLLVENSKMRLVLKRLIVHFNNSQLLQIYNLVRN
jgi:hypothetical protein